MHLNSGHAMSCTEIKRVAHVALYPPPGVRHAADGGVASYTRNLVENMVRTARDEIYVVAQRDRGASRSESVEDGITIIRCFDRDSRYVWQVARELRRIRPDVVHVQHELAVFGGRLSALLAPVLLMLCRRTRLVVTVHGVPRLEELEPSLLRKSDVRVPARLVRAVTRRLLFLIARLADEVIVHEEQFRETLVSQYSASPGKVSRVPHGVEDLSLPSRSLAREQLKVEADRRVVLFMGYATAYKGLEVLIDAARILTDSVPETLLLLGAGPHPRLAGSARYRARYANLRASTDDLVASGHARWCGFIQESDLRTYFAAADVIVFPYTACVSSSGPMALAIGARLPLIASESLRPVVPDPACVFGREPVELARRLTEFFQDPEPLRESLARCREERLFKVTAQQVRELYQLAED